MFPTAAGGKFTMSHSMVGLLVQACGVLQADHITVWMFPVHLGVFISAVGVPGRLSLSMFQRALLLTLSSEQWEWLMAGDLGLWCRSRNKASAHRTTACCLLSQSSKP